MENYFIIFNYLINLGLHFGSYKTPQVVFRLNIVPVSFTFTASSYRPKMKGLFTLQRLYRVLILVGLSYLLYYVIYKVWTSYETKPLSFTVDTN